MSYTNDFKAFAIGSGANVETPTTWAGDTVVNLGFQSGTALSIKFNTVLRQASSMAQMIGDFTAQYGPGNVQDNGDITTLKTQFISALGGLLGNGAITGGHLNLAGSRVSTLTATWTADELVVKTTLGGGARELSAYSQTLNIATTGAGGMDTGAPPASGWLYIYAIYNPTTATTGILGTVSGTGQAIYPGGNMPSGYTYSALISTLRTDGSAQFQLFVQRNNIIQGPNSPFLTGGTAGTITSINCASVIPPNAKIIGVGISHTGVTGTTYIYSESSGVIGFQSNIGAGLNQNAWIVPILTAQTIWYSTNSTINISIGQYQI